MSDCPYEPTGDGLFKCPRCGHQTRRKYDRPPKRNCTKLGMGDRVQRALSRVGLTKRRFARTIVYLHLAKPGQACGCGGRQAKLNRFGDDLARWFRSLKPKPRHPQNPSEPRHGGTKASPPEPFAPVVRD